MLYDRVVAQNDEEVQYHFLCHFYFLVAQDPDSKVPKVYDPPQRYGTDNLVNINSPRYDDLSYYSLGSDKLTPEEIAKCGKSSTAMVTGDLFERILGPSPDSSKITEALCNFLL